MANSRSYTIELLPEPEGGFTVRVPALPEVITFGADKPEAMTNAAEAISLVLEVRAQDGEPIPDDVVPVIEKLTIAA